MIKVEPPKIGDEARRRAPFPGDREDPEQSGLFLLSELQQARDHPRPPRRYREAAPVAAENVPGVRKVLDNLEARAYPPPEEDLGGGDIVSLQEQPSTADDEPL